MHARLPLFSCAAVAIAAFDGFFEPFQLFVFKQFRTEIRRALFLELL